MLREKKKTVWQISDGREFDSRAEAVEAETELTAGPRRRVDKYFASQHGKEVAREHHSSQCGLWRVHGESTENGRGRYLGIYEGRLFDVIDKVSQNANFYSYGSGGTIEKVEPIKV